MSNSEYLKRYAAPRSWIIDRKERTFISKPNPGPHPLARALPLGLVLKQLSIGNTAREIRKVLLAKEVLVDGRRVRDARFPVGLFDAIEIPEVKQSVRLHIDTKGRIILKPEHKDIRHKPCRVTGKTVLKGNKIQVSLVDGRNTLATKNDVKVGDTLVLDVPSQKVVKHLKLEPGASVLLTAGRHIGKVARVSNLDNGIVRFTVDGISSETQRENTYVIP